MQYNECPSCDKKGVYRSSSGEYRCRYCYAFWPGPLEDTWEKGR